MTHARLSPSSRYRWSVCPASVRESEGCENKSGKAAKDGTFTHLLLEKCVLTGVTTANKFVGEKLKYNDQEMRVTKQRAERVDVALNYLNRKEYYAIQSEYKVNPEAITGRNDLHGTIDLLVLSHDTVELIDYKDGRNVVNVENNPQLLQYAVGVLSQLDIIEHDTLFTLTVIQPRVDPRITSVNLRVLDIFRESTKIRLEAALTDQEWAPYVKGEHCMFCPAKDKCKEFNSSEVENMFQPITGE